MIVNRDRAGLREGPAVLLILALSAVGICLYGYFLFSRGPVFSSAALLFVLIFFASLLKLEFGIGAILLSMLLSPEIPIAHTQVRTVTLRLEDLMIIVVGLAFIGRSALHLGKRRFVPTRLFAPIMLYLAFLFLTTLRGSFLGLVDFTSSIMYLGKLLEFFLFFFLTVQYVDNLRKVKVLLVVALCTALILAFYNFLQIPTVEIFTTHRITAPFEGSVPEPSTVGGYFLMALSIILAMALHAPNVSTRNGFLLLFVLIFIPFLYTLSRTSYVGFVVMMLAFMILTRNRKLLAVFLIFVILSPFLAPKKVIDRVAYTFNDRIKVFGLFDRSLGERIFVWNKVAWNLRERPLLGGGVTKDNIIDGYYARLLIESGLIGFCLFAFIAYRIFQTGLAVYRKSDVWWVRGFGVGYLVGFIGLLVHAFSAITFYIVRIMEPFWALTGILFAIDCLRREAEKSRETADTAAPAGVTGQAERAVIAVREQTSS
jgi:hypothetical protein